MIGRLSCADGAFELVDDDCRRPQLRDVHFSLVFAGSNGLVIRRDGGWTDSDVARVGTVIEELFVFYRDKSAHRPPP